jgi:hypothetical protein
MYFPIHTSRCLNLHCDYFHALIKHVLFTSPSVVALCDECLEGEKQLLHEVSFVIGVLLF